MQILYDFTRKVCVIDICLTHLGQDTKVYLAKITVNKSVTVCILYWSYKPIP